MAKDAARAFAWFLGNNDLSTPLVDADTGSCRDGLHPDRANENRGGESVVSYLLGLAEIRQFWRCMRRSPNSTPRLAMALDSNVADPTDAQRSTLSQSHFLNRQSLYLRPDPARVVVRPFKPATEPRDLNPTDKTRANHIVDRVLGARCRSRGAATRPRCSRTSRAVTEICSTFRGARR